MTETELISEVPERLRKVQAMQTPLRRLARPEDVAANVGFGHEADAPQRQDVDKGQQWLRMTTDLVLPRLLREHDTDAEAARMAKEEIRAEGIRNDRASNPQNDLKALHRSLHALTRPVRVH